MIEVTNRSGEPVMLGVRGVHVELMPGESYEVPGYEPSGYNAPQCQVLTFAPSRDPATPRDDQGRLTRTRSDVVPEPPRSSRTL